jgi:hypothetical protein
LKHLRLAKDLTLPLDAATESFAILGRRGSGKTHTAVVMAEEMLRAGVQVVVIDPLDVWWGLRVSKDGKTAGFSIYVAGGSHADIPLSADAGKVLADAVVDQGLSIVLSTRHLSKTTSVGSSASSASGCTTGRPTRSTGPRCTSSSTRPTPSCRSG